MKLIPNIALAGLVLMLFSCKRSPEKAYAYFIQLDDVTQRVKQLDARIDLEFQNNFVFNDTIDSNTDEFLNKNRGEYLLLIDEYNLIEHIPEGNQLYNAHLEFSNYLMRGMDKYYGGIMLNHNAQSDEFDQLINNYMDSLVILETNLMKQQELFLDEFELTQ